MITENVTKNQSLSLPTWQKLLSEAIRDPAELLLLLRLDPKDVKNQAQKQFKGEHFNPLHFPLRVPRGFVKKMRKGDWNDPLLKQVLPLDEESRVMDGFQLDPVGDQEAVTQKGILQKYKGRALLITTGACAIHCRYCFRQNFPYQQHQIIKNEWHEVIETLKANTTINEVILSGGDPLVLSDNRLQTLCSQIADIPHITTLRIHTRLPLVLPERIDDEFLKWFSALDIQKIMVIHANHANEFCAVTREVLNSLHQSGVLLLNQSVLLKGINDDAEALIQLSYTLIANKVLPYYLHLLDKVQGAAHFDIEEEQALKLIERIRNTLPGYLVPKLVREISGERSKTSIN